MFSYQFRHARWKLRFCSVKLYAVPSNGYFLNPSPIPLAIVLPRLQRVSSLIYYVREDLSILLEAFDDTPEGKPSLLPLFLFHVTVATVATSCSIDEEDSRDSVRLPLEFFLYLLSIRERISAYLCLFAHSLSKSVQFNRSIRTEILNSKSRNAKRGKKGKMTRQIGTRDSGTRVRDP